MIRRELDSQQKQTRNIMSRYEIFYFFEGGNRFFCVAGELNSFYWIRTTRANEKLGRLMMQYVVYFILLIYNWLITLSVIYSPPFSIRRDERLKHFSKDGSRATPGRVARRIDTTEAGGRTSCIRCHDLGQKPQDAKEIATREKQVGQQRRNKQNSSLRLILFI